jgi:hypothetical protein
MRVKALMPGYYDNKRVKEGEEFFLRPFKGKKINATTGAQEDHLFTVEEQFSARWMESLDGPVKKPSSASKKSKKSEPKGLDLEVV